MLEFSAPLQDCAKGTRTLIWNPPFVFPLLSFRLMVVTIKLECNRTALRNGLLESKIRVDFPPNFETVRYAIVRSQPCHHLRGTALKWW